MSNTFGKRFCMTTFGESHGKAIGCILDGVPAGLEIDEEFIQSELDRRKPGKNAYATARKEPDSVEILSGVFEGVSTGTPIAMVIYNTNQKSKDYSNIKDLFRPGHADFTYWEKYGIRDYRGGGRSSARETAARVAAGAVAKLMLKRVGIEVKSGIFKIGDIEAKDYNFEYAKTSEIFALDPLVESQQKETILKAKEAHDSIGGAALVRATGVPVGLGEPIYYKLDAVLAEAMMGINAVKGVEIGEGVYSSQLYGSENNDEMTKEGFVTHHAGGTLGGISSGDTLDIKVYFKPTPSIFKPMKTLNIHGEEVTCELKGRHDPCVAIRGSVVAEAMAALVIADMMLLNMGRKMDDVARYYSKNV
ncbi:chorismate synthase [Hydrogenimonas thermophila]|uniref:chorismate synthase n=1 Tax=Hydrogenimonas thermophila TaxID=223786 RepID=UPI0029371E6D|nr:chorismate synthase [Hydrogenimonas thermophila]WOE69999.1 chorismate synthase [Hydrogenimonas thermophila]WOE72516.1 chorismate synthase [Hydrogenimonas thermophila]